MLSTAMLHIWSFQVVTFVIDGPAENNGRLIRYRNGDFALHLTTVLNSAPRKKVEQLIFSFDAYSADY